jgi:hypothetical protein
VLAAPAEAVAKRMAIQVDGQESNGREGADAGLFPSLPECRVRDRLVGDLDVPAQLNPELSLSVETQKHESQVGGENEAAGGDVPRPGIPRERAAGTLIDEPDELVAQSVLIRTVRRPGREISGQLLGDGRRRRMIRAHPVRLPTI